jgi:serine protease inhibitor
LARKSFGSDTKEVDFVNNWEKATRNINKWVEKKTRQKITKIVEPGNVVYKIILLLHLCTTLMN